MEYNPLMNCILLFDIDGTLVTRPGNGGSAGLRAMNKAAEVMTQKQGLAEGISFAGATDLDVARQLLTFGGISHPSDSQKRTLLDHYVRYMKEYIKEDAYIAVGAPHDVIPAFEQQGAVIGLGTGNVKAGALAKIQSAGIAPLFNIDNGGFGEDGETRADILRVGVARCNKGIDDSLPVVVIGDTPKDVHAAKAIGAMCVGVPSGKNTRRILLDSGADLVATSIDESLISAVAQLTGAS